MGTTWEGTTETVEGGEVKRDGLYIRTEYEYRRIGDRPQGFDGWLVASQVFKACADLMVGVNDLRLFDIHNDIKVRECDGWGK